jgi:RNA polymerase sigma factor (TIGR02999 family)
MAELTQILAAMDRGDVQAAAQLLPLVYDELRRLAAAQMAREKPGHTLDATALVHEAYLRLIGEQRFENSRHFFAAAAEAMRRILVERARSKARLRRGGGRQRVVLDEDCAAAAAVDDEVLAVDEALTRLAARDPVRAELVKLRFFGGMSMPEVAQTLGMSLTTAERNWTFARVWLYAELADEKSSSKE